MKKRILSLTMVLSILLGMLVLPASAAGFTDVKKGDYFYDAVNWAVAQGITNGTSATTFSPNDTCTKGQILTFLWRAAGSPTYYDDLLYTPTFDDVKPTDYCYDAVVWAIMESVSEETSMTIKPNTKCTRASTVEYLWRACDNWVNRGPISFSDVKSGSDLEAAVSWAVYEGITTGTSKTTFSPNDTVTRGQIVTFLYRQYVAPVDTTELTNPKPVTPVEKPLAPDNELDPLCPEDFRKGPDWYMSCTPVDQLSNYRIVIEHQRAEERLEYFRANNIGYTEPPMIREDDLYRAISYRWDRRDNPEYAKFGSIEPIREYLGY